MIGRTFGGRYQMQRPLRQGGMGAVYEALDTRLGGTVAVKVIRALLADDPQAALRFKREIRLATEIVHANVVRALDSGDDDGFLWIAMELLQGDTLRARLDSRGRMSWQETLPLVADMVSALAAAHQLGVIHRDLKPENIMLISDEGRLKAKLIDFGVAKQTHAAAVGDSHMTGTGLIVGTPGYVAPETVLEGTTDDPRSDFYALGVTWFEMLTGQAPFSAKTPIALAMRHAHEPAPTPTSLVPFAPVPAPIEALVLRLMAKVPSARPTTAVELGVLLSNLLADSLRSLTLSPAVLRETDPTVTDLRGMRTGVVPFATPHLHPETAPNPSVRAASITANATPSLLLASTSPPELLRPLPRSWRVLAAPTLVGAVVVVVVVVVAIVFGVNFFKPWQAQLSTQGVLQPHTVVTTEPAWTERTTAEPPPWSPPPAPPLPKSGEVSSTSTAFPFAGSDPTTMSSRDKTPSPAGKEKAKIAAVAPTSPGPLPVTEVTDVRLSPRPKDLGWKVGIDGGFPMEAPLTLKIRRGEHTLLFTSTRLTAATGLPEISVTRELNIVDGKPISFMEDLTVLGAGP